MIAATNRRNRRADARSRRRAGATWVTRTPPTAHRRRSGDATLLVLLEGEVVGHVKGSDKRDYIVDPLGSVVAYLNSPQTLTDQFEYWPYGEMVAEIEAGTEPFLWVGSLGYFRENDLRTYIRAREYRQDLGSWMQLDPLWPDHKPYDYRLAVSSNSASAPSSEQNEWTRLCEEFSPKSRAPKGPPADPDRVKSCVNNCVQQLLKGGASGLKAFAIRVASCYGKGTGGVPSRDQRTYGCCLYGSGVAEILRVGPPSKPPAHLGKNPCVKNSNQFSEGGCCAFHFCVCFTDPSRVDTRNPGAGLLKCVLECELEAAASCGVEGWTSRDVLGGRNKA